MSYCLQDKIAIVTGGARGMGEVTARLFALQELFRSSRRSMRRVAARRSSAAM